MNKVIILLLFLIPTCVRAQNTFTTVVRDKNGKVLPSASVEIKALQLFYLTDTSGMVSFHHLPNGKLDIRVSYVGYLRKNIRILLPLKNSINTFFVELEKDTAALQEVIVNSTRSNKNIELIPTRIEAITKEELDEKSSMKPGDIRMLLNESTGITAQQISAVSGSTDLRIQGLDGRYTQLLKDGMPLFDGFSGSLSIVQIPPLDLKQVEFIKGSASTLYGGGAIAGLVNLISKTPTAKKELSFLLNGNTTKGIDASSFYSEKFKKLGVTLFTAYNYNAPYDPANIGLTEIPQINRVTINPKLFFYPNATTSGFFGLNIGIENRFGGDMQVITRNTDSIHQYFEKNISQRISSQFNVEHNFNAHSKIQFKNAISFFNRNLTQPNTGFHAQQISSFSELNYSLRNKKSEWIMGMNVWTNNLNPLDTSTLHYQLTTIGGFIQNTYKPIKWITVESGVRIDKNNPASNNKSKGMFILPRLNFLLNLSQHITSRIGGGLGYKMPSPFNDDAEQKGYQYIMPINIAATKAEQSYGLNADITYKHSWDEVVISINQLLFYTQINSPLILNGNNFITANGFINSKGTESNIRIAIDELNFYIGYTYADVQQHFNGISTTQPLSPKSRLNFDVTYEKENNYRIGFEGFYTGKQLLNDVSIGKQYTVLGFLVEKIWKRMNVFLNIENLTDQRQTKWDKLYTGTITNPQFKDVYTPIDGIAINSGIKIKL